MDRKTVAILFGGPSEEHDISIKSAMELAANIDTEKYQPVYVGITRAGVWKRCAKPCPDWARDGGEPAVLLPDLHGLLIRKEEGYEIQHVDVVFPIMHGKFGEDGVIQGVLSLSGIPYVGCDIQSSVICMDKSLAYLVVKSAGIPVPDFQVLLEGDRPEPETLKFPLFVKPARSGSSFGVSKVERQEDLSAAIDKARQYDGKVLLERAVSGCEVGCAVLGDGGGVVTGEVDQICLKYGFFQIHQEAQPEKGSENAVIKVPAELPPEVSARVRETAMKIYRVIGCRGLARVDLFLQEDGQIVLNEVNTMPGFTSYSRYPRMMAAAGIPLSALIHRLIQLALGR